MKKNHYRSGYRTKVDLENESDDEEEDNEEEALEEIDDGDSIEEDIETKEDFDERDARALQYNPGIAAYSSSHRYQQTVPINF